MRIVLKKNESLTAVMTGAAAATNPTYSVDYVDANGVSYNSTGSLSGATVATILEGGSAPRTVRGLTICNIDTSAVTIALKKVATDATTKHVLAPLTMQVNDTLVVDEVGRVSTIDAAGQVKQTATSTTVVPIAISPLEWRKTDGVTVNAVTAATTNFGLVYGSDGTDFPHLETIDSKAATTAVVSRTVVRLPANYVAGSAITLRARCGMKTTVADNSAATTIDFNAYSNSGVANLGSADLVTTAAQSINSLTAANYDFTVTPTGLVAGQDLHVKMTLTVTDAATGTAVIGTVNHVELRTSVSQ